MQRCQARACLDQGAASLDPHSRGHFLGDRHRQVVVSQGIVALGRLRLLQPLPDVSAQDQRLAKGLDKIASTLDLDQLQVQLDGWLEHRQTFLQPP
jgi:hypothetical protein